MVKCGYCNDKITLAPNGFSGIDKKIKFCMSCWSKIYTAYSGLEHIENEPQILKWVLKIEKPNYYYY